MSATEKSPAITPIEKHGESGLVSGAEDTREGDKYTRRDSNPDCWFRRPKCYPLHYGCVSKFPKSIPRGRSSATTLIAVECTLDPIQVATRSSSFFFDFDDPRKVRSQACCDKRAEARFWPVKNDYHRLDTQLGLLICYRLACRCAVGFVN